MLKSRGRKQDIDFRKDEVSYIMQRWRGAASCSLIGVASVGKSNLLQHLIDPDVHRAYLPQMGIGQFKPVIIDPNLLGPLPTNDAEKSQISSWAGYELMLHRLFMAFYPFDDIIGPEEGERFYQLYEQLQDGKNPLYAYMGLRYFELALDILMRHDIHVVFMFDEFEKMLRKLPENFFQALRGLRDANKRNLSYLTFARAPLNILVEQYDKDPLEMEPFTELFTDNILYIPPYNEIDAKKMVDALMDKNGKRYSDIAINFLLTTTGSYAGLIRSGFSILGALGTINQSSVMDSNLIRQMAGRRPIRMECERIWQSLTPPEQHILRASAGLETYDSNPETDDAVTMLIQKRLLYIDHANNNLHIQPPLFKAFVLNNSDAKTLD